MKKIKSIIFIYFLILCSGIAFSQQNDPNGFKCEIPSNAPQIDQTVIGGQHKPESIDRYTNDPLAVFRILIVFVQFANDPGPAADYWPVNGQPTFLNSVTAQFKNTNYGTSWWDAYNETNAPLSDFWMEASRGHFHIVGKTVNVILPQEYTYYQTFGSRGIEKINDDIYTILQDDPSIDWPSYDLWSKSGSSFAYVPDGKVDMIYKVHRSHSPLMGMPAGGIAYLYSSYSQGENYKIYDNGLGTQIFVNGGFGDNGSGLTMTPGHGYAENDPRYFRYMPINKTGVISFSEHEHGHYIFGGGHQKYGKMMGAYAEYGVDEFLSPYESIRLGYMNSKPAVFNTLNTLNDYSSRYVGDEGQVLEVPISGGNEFFLIANRQRVSNYDRIMWGDTAHGDPYRNINQEYGKGIYIYHAAPGITGYPFLIPIDNECADGLWNWQFSGYEHPDWSTAQEVDYYTRTTVDYTHNDNGGDAGLLYHDGKSLYNWFGIGKKESPQGLGGDGTDRLFTNSAETWTSREWQGDRWDPWKVEYNQVFSPYSSPSTVNWSNSQTGIFIYLESQNGTTANFKIYKIGVDGITEETILAATPPSKPMGLTISLTDCNREGRRYPKLKWNQNMEPDMIRSGSNTRVYMVLKAWSTNTTTIPVNYYPLQYVSAPAGDEFAECIDNGTYGDCGFSVPNHFARYKVIAIDNGETVPEKYSVHSDFVSTSALVTNYIPWRRPHDISNPAAFNLEQNYPNPFNPSTEIKFDIPQNTFVTLKVYNAIGQVVAELVNNEYKNAGSYSVNFDGSYLASGIYFYSIEAGTFKEVKKMVLIK